MGVCASSPQDQQQRDVSKAIDRTLKTERSKLNQQFKMLLLGSGESGKSTFFKQMKIISSTLSEKDRQHFRTVIRSNCISQAQQLIQALPSADLTLKPESQKAADDIMELDPDVDGVLSPKVVQDLKILWADESSKLTYQQRGRKFQLNDALDYFFENVEKFGDESYLPSEEDILRARIRTTGIEEAQFTISDFTFRLIDVGGQRSERRKWLHCFDSVTAIFYFVALNEFDMLLREDDTVYRMLDSLALFEGVCNSPWFRNVTFILLLNKTDLFREKIEQIDLKICFPDYNGGRQFSAASEYIKQKFLKVNKSPHDIFVHFIVALDTDNIKLVFDATRQSLLAQSIASNYGLTMAEASRGAYT